MATVEPSTEIAYRIDFPLLCNARGIVCAVEVGVAQAVFASAFLERWNGHTLWLVDDYTSHAEYPGNRHGDLLSACLNLTRFPGRFRFLGMRSEAAAAFLPDWAKPGFVYIDAAHDFNSVCADLKAWWPKVEAGGILAGHDYDPTHPGVVAAVDRFAEANNLVVRLTRDELASWYVYKGEPELLQHYFFNRGTSPNPHFKGQESQP